MSRVLTHQMEHESPTATFVKDFQRRTKLKSVIKLLNVVFGLFICITNKDLFCKQGIHAILGQSEQWATWQLSEEQAETMLRMKSGGNLVMTFFWDI